MIKEIIRFITAIIFIISGSVKAIDPVGFSFKLEEYFSPSVFDLPFLMPYTLAIAIAVVSIEIILGLFLLLKIHLKLTLIALISMCVFFGFLTFYSAYYNVVTDCGCFGDAIKFTPWQSFFKDLILLFILFFLWKKYSLLNEEKNFKKAKGFILISSIVLMIITIKIGIQQEPIVDFRDYKIGTNLKTEKEKITQNPSEYKIIYTLKNKETKEETIVNQDDYINKKYWEDSNWEIQSDKTQTEISKQGYTSAIDKFDIENEKGQNITDSILSAPKAILVFSYKPDEVSKELLEQIESKLSLSRDKVLIYGVSTKLNVYQKIPNATMDATAIKTIARSNPFILELSNAQITKKSSAKDWLNND